MSQINHIGRTNIYLSKNLKTSSFIKDIIEQILSILHIAKPVYQKHNHIHMQDFLIETNNKINNFLDTKDSLPAGLKYKISDYVAKAFEEEKEHHELIEGLGNIFADWTKQYDINYTETY